jgi:hypothetical protein
MKETKKTQILKRKSPAEPQHNNLAKSLFATSATMKSACLHTLSDPQHQSAIGLCPIATGVGVVVRITVEGTLIRLTVEFRYTMPVPVLGFGFKIPGSVAGGVAGIELEAGLENEGVTGELSPEVKGDLGVNSSGEGSCVGRLLGIAPNETEGTGTAGLSPEAWCCF